VLLQRLLHDFEPASRPLIIGGFRIHMLGPARREVTKMRTLKLAPRRLIWSVLQRLTKAAVVIALASSIGLHWALFQSVAWVGMVLSYSQEATLAEALSKTFDGKHPCALCREIAKTKQSDKKSDVRFEVKKFEFSYAPALFVFSRPVHFWKICLAEPLDNVLGHSPPVPPPKSYPA
jgi:hypothetical protein